MNTEMEQKAVKALESYVLAAAATGGIPVPASSVAIAAENAAMIGNILAIFELQVGVPEVVKAFGVTTLANQFGRAVFIEGAKLLAWGTGGWATVGLIGLGATTAAIQTYILGRLTIAFCANGGVLDGNEARAIDRSSRTDFSAFFAQARKGR